MKLSLQPKIFLAVLLPFLSYWEKISAFNIPLLLSNKALKRPLIKRDGIET